MWGDVLYRGSGRTEVPSGVQGRIPGRGSGGRSPPEAEAILDFYMHNFDLILNYFCFARATIPSIRYGSRYIKFKASQIY